MAYEHLVKNVKCGESAYGKRFSYDLAGRSDDMGGVFTLTKAEIGAIETWLAQPKPPTLEERAESLSRAFSRKYKGFDDVPNQVWGVLAADVANAIQQAIEADRAARGET